MNVQKPELLAPAGTPEALAAAVAAGADAVYFGTGTYNARANARNFDADELFRAVSLLHAHGIKAHVTLNIALFDRDMEGALETARLIYESGADAAIVSDLGLAARMRNEFPGMELHASTQAGGHSVRDAEYFAGVGFSRMVCGRELSHSDIKTLAERSPIGIEMFVHGAVCVSVSGQCLFSSLVGGRSGNRGECAQPCRLPYECAGGVCYPLSPKDMCLAGHMREILSLGVCSLKIEGRMRAPDYVYAATSLYRRLIDEERDAEPDEIAALARVFSRSGFTDAYFTGAVRDDPDAMMGVRTEEDKSSTRAERIEIPDIADVPIDKISAKIIAGEPSFLTVEANGRAVSVTGGAPDAAISRPLTAAGVAERLSKFGGTGYAVTPDTKFDIEVGDGLIMSMSAINELRRRAAAALAGRRQYGGSRPVVCERIKRPDRPILTAEFLRADAVTDAARAYFDRIYLPLDEYDSIADGFTLPPVIVDSDEAAVRDAIERAVLSGAKYALISGAGQTALTDGYGLSVTASHRFNICGTDAASAALRAGADIVTLSPEATAAQMRDIAARAPSAAIVYGRVPLMTTGRCIIHAAAGGRCACGRDPVWLTDRRGARFPMWGLRSCGTVIYNSVPVYMADKEDELQKIGLCARHFIFTDEDGAAVDAVIDAYKRGTPPRGDIRRIKAPSGGRKEK